MTTTVTVFGHLDALLMLDAGSISNETNFGTSTLWGIEATAGVDVAVSREIRLRAVLEYSRIALSFDLNNLQTAGRDGDMTTKDIYGATDRSIGAVATIGVVY